MAGRGVPMQAIFPGLSGTGGEPGPNPSSEPVRMPVGALTKMLQASNVGVFEREYRVLPEDSMYNPRLSPNKPFKFAIGTYRVPENQSLMLVDYQFAAHRLSGISAGDTTPLEPEAMSTLWGFDLSVNNSRDRDTEYQIDPVPSSATGNAYQTITVNHLRTASVSRYTNTAANGFAVASGAASSTMPFSPRRFGPTNGPITMWVGPGLHVVAECIIARALRIPLAFVSVRLSGYKVPFSIMQKFRATADV